VSLTYENEEYELVQQENRVAKRVEPDNVHWEFLFWMGWKRLGVC
jgi:hypothetical protein